MYLYLYILPHHFHSISNEELQISLFTKPSILRLLFYKELISITGRQIFWMHSIAVNYLKPISMFSLPKPDHICEYHMEYNLFMHFAIWISVHLKGKQTFGMTNAMVIVNYLKLTLTISLEQPEHNCMNHRELHVFIHFAT